MWTVCHFSSAVEQRIRNAQVGSSNLPSGSKGGRKVAFFAIE